MLVELGPPETPLEGKVELERLAETIFSHREVMSALEAAYRCGVVQSAHAKRLWKKKNDAENKKNEEPSASRTDTPDHIFAIWTEVSSGKEIAGCHKHIPAYIDISSDFVEVWEYGDPNWTGTVRCWHCDKLLAQPEKAKTEDEEYAEQELRAREVAFMRKQVYDSLYTAVINLEGKVDRARIAQLLAERSKEEAKAAAPRKP